MKKYIFTFISSLLIGTAAISLYGDFQEVLETKEHTISQLTKELEESQQAVHKLEERVGKTLLANSKLSYGEKLNLTPKERNCLLRNVYYEAGIEPFSGKIGVAQLTLNRLKEGRWGNSFCAVVHSRSQFSWTRRKTHETPSGVLWEETKKAVELFEAGLRLTDLKDALYYHADWIADPKWADVDHKIAQIGQHIFYKDAKKK